MFYLRILALVATTTPFSTGDKETDYQNPIEYTVIELHPTSETVPLRSKLECAKVCALNTHCLTFHFNKTSMACQWSNEVINTGNGNIYGLRNLAVKDCPVDLGYNIYGRDGAHLCIKLVASKEIHDAAQAKCINDGGHLIQVKADKEHQLVEEVLRSNHVVGGFWADGKGVVGSTFFGWNGGEVIWLKWGEGQPKKNGLRCLRHQRGLDYFFSDSDCSRARPYVCQMF